MIYCPFQYLTIFKEDKVSITSFGAIPVSSVISFKLRFPLSRINCKIVSVQYDL